MILRWFVAVHMRTYKPEFISRYSRLSSILEMDMNLAQQALREVSIMSTQLAKDTAMAK